MKPTVLFSLLASQSNQSWSYDESNDASNHFDCIIIFKKKKNAFLNFKYMNPNLVGQC